MSSTPSPIASPGRHTEVGGVGLLNYRARTGVFAVPNQLEQPLRKLRGIFPILLRVGFKEHFSRKQNFFVGSPEAEWPMKLRRILLVENWILLSVAPQYLEEFL